MRDNGRPHDGRMEHQKKSKEVNPKRTLSIYSNLPLNIEPNTGQNMHKTAREEENSEMIKAIIPGAKTKFGNQTEKPEYKWALDRLLVISLVSWKQLVLG